MRNPSFIDLQNIAEKMPDNDLADWVLNPQPGMPPVIPVAELGRRHDLRQRYKQTEVGPPEQTTVAEDAIRNAGLGGAASQQPAVQQPAQMPSSIMPQLPPPPPQPIMPPPQQMAAMGGPGGLGGLGQPQQPQVYARGGRVRGYAHGGTTHLSYNPTSRPDLSAGGRGLNLSWADRIDKSLSDASADMNPRDRNNPYPSSRDRAAVASTPYRPPRAGGWRGDAPPVATSISDVRGIEYGEAKRQRALEAALVPPLPTDVENRLGAQDLALKGLGEAIGTGFSPDMSAFPEALDIAEPPTGNDYVVGDMPTRDASTQFQSTPFTEELGLDDPIDAIEAKQKELDRLREMGMPGLDKQQERLNERREEMDATRQRHEALGLIGIGLSIMGGTSPFAAVNIGGPRVVEAVNKYGETMFRLDATEDEIADAEFGLENERWRRDQQLQGLAQDHADGLINQQQFNDARKEITFNSKVSTWAENNANKYRDWTVNERAIDNKFQADMAQFNFKLTERDFKVRNDQAKWEVRVKNLEAEKARDIAIWTADQERVLSEYNAELEKAKLEVTKSTALLERAWETEDRDIELTADMDRINQQLADDSPAIELIKYIGGLTGPERANAMEITTGAGSAVINKAATSFDKAYTTFFEASGPPTTNEHWKEIQGLMGVQYGTLFDVFKASKMAVTGAPPSGGHGMTMNSEGKWVMDPNK